jgi:serine/threonine protein kinase
MWESGQILQERYQIQRRLGRTIASRQTWLAKDLSVQSHELVVVKLLVFTPQFQWADLKLFEREAQVLQNINHSQIPHYRDYFVVEQNTSSELLWWGLVQDYIPGKTLQELLEEGKRFNQQEVRRITQEILQILSYLHEFNPPVLHRDIKPSNLILGDDQKMYLVDFGAVQHQAVVTGVTFTVVGTCGYAPMEQFWGKAIPASDLYALGATLIHLLTGIAPAELQNNLRIQFRDRLSKLNSNFASWLEKLTEPAFEKRFATARQALTALKNIAVEMPISKTGKATKSVANGAIINKPEDTRFLDCCKFFSVLLGVYILSQIPHSYQSAVEFQDTAISTTGIVIKAWKETSVNPGGGIVPTTKSTYYYSIIGFNTLKGQYIEFQASSPCRNIDSCKGKKFSILYDPCKPQKAEVNRGHTPLDKILHLIIFGSFFLCVGIGWQAKYLQIRTRYKE